MRRGVAVLCAILMFACIAQAEDRSDIEQSGDYLTVLLPLSGYVASAIYLDWEGAVTLTGSLVTSQLTVEGLKLATEKWRPNMGSPKSFPSGHSAGGFTGASFLGTRYGPVWGYPAYGLAIWCAYTRVHESKHFVDDVTSGAAISILSNFAWVRPYSERWNFAPTYDSRGMGLQFSYRPGRKAYKQREGSITWEETFKKQYRFEWEFGPVWRDYNQIKSPTDTGDEFDLADFSETANPYWTARISFDIYLGDRHEVDIIFAPYSIHDFGSFSRDTSFAGVTYAANTRTESKYYSYEMRLRYRYQFEDGEHWSLKVGGGATMQWLGIELTQDTLTSDVTDFVILPMVHFYAGWKFARNWRLAFETDLTVIDDIWTDSAVFFNWQFDERWDAKIGYRLWYRDILTDELTNVNLQHRMFLALAYAW